MIQKEHDFYYNTNKLMPEISFGWIERSVSNEMLGYVFVITISFKNTEEQTIIGNLLGRKGLEYILIENDPEYKSLLNMEKGLALYVKKHAKTDSDYSQGFFFGYTVYESYQILTEELENIYQSKILFAKDAIEKLIKFKEMLTKEVDWETIKVAMLELSDFDKMLSEIQKL